MELLIMSKFTAEDDNSGIQQLKLLRLVGEEVKQGSVRENTSFALQDELGKRAITVATKMRLEREKTFIFTPKNDLEELAIAIATAGETGWKESLYSLEYTDTYGEHNCFIFATQPKESDNQRWLLVSNDSKHDVKYLSALGKMPLKDIYYAWTKTV
jgi:hypothetical protein